MITMPCPWCRNTSIVPIYDDTAPKGERWAMYCRSGCGAKGPDAESKDAAVVMWISEAAADG